MTAGLAGADLANINEAALLADVQKREVEPRILKGCWETNSWTWKKSEIYLQKKDVLLHIMKVDMQLWLNYNPREPPQALLFQEDSCSIGYTNTLKRININAKTCELIAEGWLFYSWWKSRWRGIYRRLVQCWNDLERELQILLNLWQLFMEWVIQLGLWYWKSRRISFSGINSKDFSDAMVQRFDVRL